MSSPAVFHPHWGTEVKLGALPKRADEHVLKLDSYDTALPAPPTSAQWGVHVPMFPMYANDRLGDCTCAAVGHQIQAWTSMNGAIWTPTEQEVTDFYWATGDGSGQDDTGRVETDVLNYWKSVGFGQRKDKLGGFVSVNPLNHTQVKQALWLFGGLYIGISLPISAQTQSYWKLVPDDGSGNTVPGSWGGHAVNVTAYTSTYLVVVTWGARLRMSWGFWNKYVSETYALLSQDWVTGAKAAPNGLNLAALQNDLAAV